jgi:hypothetical protein
MPATAPATSAPSDALEAEPWEVWLAAILPDLCTAPFGDHHVEFWEWLWAIEPGIRPEAFAGVWARGGAKSTSAEAAVVALGCRRRRRYGLYVCETQDQADDHVANIGAVLESDQVALWYPEMSQRMVGKFGNSKGWRRNRLRTATGFTVDAIGLDTAARGIKLEDQRPDFLVLDDLDHHDDSPRIVARKIKAITKALIPAGAEDVAVLAIQNLVHRDGVFARLVDGRAQFLARRQVSGPIPALYGLVTEHRAETDEHGAVRGRDIIVAGTPSWAGQPVERCQEMIDDMGLVAFLEECQHDVSGSQGALWATAQVAAVRANVAEVDLAAITVAVDPSGGDGPDSDAQGIIVGARDVRRGFWVLDDLTCTLPPHGWARRAVEAWRDHGADDIVAEVNYGGAMVVANVEAVARQMLAAGEIERMPVVRTVNASRGKRVRAEPVAALYGRPDEPDTWSTARAHHGGHFVELEDEMTTWNPDNSTWSPNRVDALVWAASHLLGLAQGGKRRRRGIVSVSAA